MEADKIYLKASAADLDDLDAVPDTEETFTEEEARKDPVSFLKFHEKYTGLNAYIAATKLHKTDPRRYYVLAPKLFKNLMASWTSSRVIMGKCWPVIADMLIMARSYTSKLLHSGIQGGTLDLSKFIKGHTYHTVLADFPPDTTESTVHQCLYLLSALDYDEQIQGPKGGEQVTDPSNIALRARKAEQAGGSFATKGLRQLAILTLGNQAGIFDARARKMKISTLTKDTQRWREKGFSLEYLVNSVLEPGEPVPKTAYEYLERFCVGAPKVRALVARVVDVCIKKDRKFLLAEGNVLVAIMNEMAINYIHIKAATMHSGLSSSERVKLAKRFRNDPKATTLKILEIMYDVTVQGIDLHEFCADVGIGSPGRNAMIELQILWQYISTIIHQ